MAHAVFGVWFGDGDPGMNVCQSRHLSQTIGRAALRGILLAVSKKVP